MIGSSCGVAAWVSLGSRDGPGPRLPRRGRRVIGCPRPHRARRGGQRLGAVELAGARARARPGCDRAAADLVVGPPDPRPVALRLGVPEGERRLQPDIRRLAPSRDARGRCRVLPRGPRTTGEGLDRFDSAPPDRVGGRADRLARRGRDIPGRARRGGRREPDRRAPGRAMADRTSPRALRRVAVAGRSSPGGADRWETWACARRSPSGSRSASR